MEKFKIFFKAREIHAANGGNQRPFFTKMAHRDTGNKAASVQVYVVQTKTPLFNSPEGGRGSAGHPPVARQGRTGDAPPQAAAARGLGLGGNGATGRIS